MLYGTVILGLPLFVVGATFGQDSSLFVFFLVFIRLRYFPIFPLLVLQEIYHHWKNACFVQVA